MTKIMDRTDIRISTCFKKITIDYSVSINYDTLDMDEFMLFIWKNDSIVGNICFISQIKYNFEIVTKNGTEYFHSYDEVKKYFKKNNLV